MKKYILASKSPRRKDLLRNLIETYLIVDPDIEEVRQAGETPDAYVVRNAERKAQAVAETMISTADQEWTIIAADTIVVDGERILGKPADPSQAIQMLTELRGKTHLVYSGIAVLDSGRKEIQTRQAVSRVPMREYTDDEIADYVASGDPMDKAGAYAIQNQEFDPAPTINDCFANVMGLPLCDLAVVLHKLDCPIQSDVAQRCQEYIQYHCPIFPAILAEMNGKESV